MISFGKIGVGAIDSDEEISGTDVSGTDVSGDDVSGDDVSGDDVSGTDVSGDDVSGIDVSGIGLRIYSLCDHKKLYIFFKILHLSDIIHINFNINCI